MTRSGAPFHGAHGEGRSAISPAASQAGVEPWARACPAARARTNAPVISDNAVVAAPMNWRAESTGDPLPLSRPATQLAEIMAKVDRPCLNQVCSQHRKSVRVVFRPPVFNRYIPAFDKPGLVQAPMKRGQHLPGVARRFPFEKSNDRRLRLLRPRR